MKSTILKFGFLTLALIAFSKVNAQEQKQPDPEKAFARMDANKDNSISLDEFKNMKRKNEVPADKLEKRFSKMDADSNGSVTLEEFKTSLTNVGNKGEGNKNQ